MKSKLLLCLSLVCVLFSCNKDNDDSIRHYVQGEWRLTKIGADLNGNETLESNEMIPLPDSTIMTTFYEDGTGLGSFNAFAPSNGVPFTWSTDERDHLLTVNSQTTSFTTKFKVQDIDNFSLLNQDVNIFGAKIWTVYSRQK